MAQYLTATSDWATPPQPMPLQPARSANAATPWLKLVLVTACALAVHGYHLGVDDSEIYVPAVKKVADPALFPFGDEFFLTHAHFSLFSNLLGNLARLTHLSPDLVIFLCHLTGVFLLLLACWQVSSACFRSSTACWGSVLVIAALLTLPITGTGLFLMDCYVTARSISTPGSLLAVAAFLSGKPKQAILWLLFVASIHVQMAVYAAGFLGLIAIMQHLRIKSPIAFAGVLPPLFQFSPPTGAAREALLSRTYFFVTNWTWYEWIGVFAPILLLAWFAGISPRRTRPAFRLLAKASVPFGLISTGAALVLALSPRLENLTRLQPMRAFHLLYVVFFILLGGLVGEYALGDHLWRWLALLVPLAGVMGIVQIMTYRTSPHVEWPIAQLRSDNVWTNAFLWIRDNTPKNALFAMDPDYMREPADDQHGFRAVAERSALADEVKDSGAVSLFPQLAEHWKAQVEAQAGWAGFQLDDYARLLRQYPVDWLITSSPGPTGFDCPYTNESLAVCRVDAMELAFLRTRVRAAKVPAVLVRTLH